MGKNRLEASSDGAPAITIAITVLELKAPHGTEFEALKPLMPGFLSYALSFVCVGNPSLEPPRCGERRLAAPGHAGHRPAAGG